mgnify:CR=1 FL=1
MKVKWNSECPVPIKRTEYNIGRCKELGLPGLSVKSDRPPLAVVGGGPSVADFVDELRAFKGDIWTSGSAFPYVTSLGIESTFFTIDQSPQLAIDGKGAKKAILATCCDPSVFKELATAHIEVFDLRSSGPEANHNATTITAAPRISIDMGYRDITFYGCDSSFREGSHAYDTDEIGDMVKVVCCGKEFITRPSFMMQGEFMAEIFRMAPNVFKLRGDGLMEKMIINPECDVTHAAPHLAEQLLKKVA